MGEVSSQGIIVHDDALNAGDYIDRLPRADDNKTKLNGSNILTAGPIAGLVAGVVVFIAVIGMIGYKLSRNSSPDNAYKAM